MGAPLLAAGTLLIAFNLRASMAALGPLADTVRNELGLSSALVGLLTTLPLLAFAGISTLTPMLTRRIGTGATLSWAMALLATGILLRSGPNVATLLAGTLLLGIAIALANVLMPSLVKENFGRHYGTMTSLYSCAMSVGASLAAGISVPLATWAWGWRGSLASWALLAAAAWLLWLPQLKRLPRTGAGRNFMAAMRHLGRSRIAWSVALFMGLQSLTFYVFLAWLPDMVQAAGHSAHYAGWMLSLSQITSAVGSLAIPLWAARRRDQRAIVRTMVAMETVALLGLALPGIGGMAVWITLLGLSLGGAFSLSLFMIGARAPDAATATELSGMVQSVGYLIAAAGPFIAGSLFDLGGSWLPVLAMLATVVAVKLAVGTGAAKARVITY